MTVNAATKMLEQDFAAHEFLCGDVLDCLDSIKDARFRLIVSSPPYNIGKSYEKDKRRTLQEYSDWQSEVVERLHSILEDDGSVCWQVGSFVRGNEYVPLDIIFYKIFTDAGFKLRNRIVWKFNFGLNSDKRFSGRYETVLWFTKSDKYVFNLDSIRIPQLYPGKRHVSSKGVDKAGKPSGNPLGKNPSDYWEFSADRDFVENPIWDIPNVKANHPEKTSHPCQFPIELAERCVLAFTNAGDKILDPFVGTGASILAAEKHGRVGTGIDRDRSFISIAEGRLQALQNNKLAMRPSGMPVRRPNPNEKVSKVPSEWSDAET